MPGKTRTAKTLTPPDLSSEIPKILDQAQLSTANHQKNYVALYKLHLEAARLTDSVNGDILNRTRERAFEDVFIHMVARVLPVKKGDSPIDRVVKFAAGYTKFVNEKAAEELTKKEDGDGSENDDDTTASRFTARLLRFLSKGFVAKDKSVRYRVLQLVAEMVSHLGEIDEEIYTLLRSALLDRIHDKEPSIRVQAVIALSRLSGAEDPADVAEGEPTVTEVLTDTLAHDPSADVRRAALMNVSLNPTTLIHILARTRDTDTTIRKLVYSVLDPNSQQGEATGITHPRALTVAQRELIVRNGLGDREQLVKAAAENLLGIWVDVISDKESDEKRQTQLEDNSTVDDVVAFLRMFDLAEGKVAEDALLSVFTTRVGIFDNLKFRDEFWLSLIPEKAFLARVFVEHCIATKDDARLESVLPVVTALAFKIQSSYNDLLEDIQAQEEERFLRGMGADDENRSQKEDDRMEKELVISEMLKLAVNLDYADEIGRRKMFQLVRDMISQDTLPENLVARCLDVLRKLSANERDLIRVVVEVVHDLRDPCDPDEDAPKPDDTETEYGGTPVTIISARAPRKPMAERTPEESARAEAIDLRCLSLCIGMLERVNGTFEENSTLEGILGELIIPAVKSKELALREKGLISLGLCCLIARRMALNSFQLFLNQIQSSPEVLKIRVLQIVFDILMVQEGEFLGKRDENAENILKFLLNLLLLEHSQKVQALISIGIAKLMLSGMICDERALTNLVMIYLSPQSVDNHELRQALSYFFPVYCYSSPSNQRRVQEIFLPTFQKWSEMHKELDDDEEMVSTAQVGGMFLDWTDPLKAVSVQGQKPDDMIHFDMASDIVRALFGKKWERSDKKVLCQLLGKLHIPDKVDDYKLRCLKVLMHNLSSRQPLHDTTANNAFMRFDAAISKKFQKQLEDFNEEEYRKLAELKDLFEFLDDIIPEDDAEEININASKKKGKTTRKRRSESVVSTSTEATSTNSRRGTTKSKAKRRRLSTSDDESDDEDDQTESGLTPPPPSSLPTRTLPKRSAAVKKIIIDVDAEDIDDDDQSTPGPASRKDIASHRYRKTDSWEEAKLDAEIDHLLIGETSLDSILDSDNSEDEEEVNDILAQS